MERGGRAVKAEHLTLRYQDQTVLARALAVEGEVWLLDEPFAGVDPQRAERILKRLKELDRPILLTGHAPGLEMWCDRVAALPGERG